MRLFLLFCTILSVTSAFLGGLQGNRCCPPQAELASDSCRFCGPSPVVPNQPIFSAPTALRPPLPYQVSPALQPHVPSYGAVVSPGAPQQLYANMANEEHHPQSLAGWQQPLYGSGGPTAYSAHPSFGQLYYGPQPQNIETFMPQVVVGPSSQQAEEVKERRERQKGFESQQAQDGVHDIELPVIRTQVLSKEAADADSETVWRSIEKSMNSGYELKDPIPVSSLTIIDDPVCNNNHLRAILRENIDDDLNISKRLIQLAAETQFGGQFDVICSNNGFSYLTNTELYCQESSNGVSCYAYRQL